MPVVHADVTTLALGRGSTVGELPGVAGYLLRTPGGV
jgi:hypothetical protein